MQLQIDWLDEQTENNAVNEVMICSRCKRQIDGFFPKPLARNSDPSTSHLAARDASFKASAHRIKALNALNQRPMTDFELAAVTGLQQNSIGKRRKDCQDVGFVMPHTDEKRVKVRRPAPSGSLAQVWKITPSGEKYLKDIT